MKVPVESWEKPHIRKLIWKASIGGIAGVIAVGGMSFLFSAIGWGHISPGLFSLSWIIVLLFTIPIAYHQGVCDERDRRTPKKTES